MTSSNVSLPNVSKFLSTRQTLTLLSLVFFSFFSLSCKKEESGSAGSAPSNTIKIGEVGSMTGAEASFGKSTHQGIAMAVEEINAKGGVLGKQIEIVSLDDQGKPEEAATAVTKLINQDNVIAILGEVASSRSLAMAPIAQKNKVPMITPSSTNPKVTEQGDFIFRVCFIDPFQGQVMAKFAFEDLNLRKVAILRDVKNDYSVGLADFFTETFTKLGGEILVDQSYSAGDIDFKSQLTSIKTTNPQAIFVPGYYTEVGLIARQAKELGITVPFLGGDGWDSPKLIEIGGQAMEGHYFSNHYHNQDQSPMVQNFVKKYQGKYNEMPDSMSASGYDATLILADAIKRAGTTSSAELRNSIAQTQNFAGVTGSISIDEKRNARKPAVVIQVKSGSYQFLKSVAPL